MDDDERPLLSRILLDAARQLLAADDRPWEVVGGEMLHLDLQDALAASIGLANTNELRGKLVIIAPPELFRSVYPPEIARRGISDASLANWASEVANQLLGRIKNLLSAHGVDFSIGIPAVIAGDRLRLLGRNPGASVEHSVRVGGLPVDLLLEMERAGGRKILGEDGETVPTAPEGSSVLF
jgi:hypothetical protein